MRPATVGKDTNIIIDLYKRGTNRHLIAQALGWKKSQIDYIIANEKRREKRYALYESRMAEMASPETMETTGASIADGSTIELSVPGPIIPNHNSTFDLPVKLRVSVSVI